MTRLTRKIHRVLGLAAGLQLLAWTAGGLFFSLNPLAKVRGETERSKPLSLQLTRRFASPSPAIDAVRRAHSGAAIDAVTLRPLVNGAVYEIAFHVGPKRRYALADANTGALRGELSSAEAVALARADFSPGAPITSVQRITTVEPGSEYRGKPLPAYRVVFDHAIGTRIYVAAKRGRITARRNDRWRWFDFFWTLHVMDYRHRDDFNTLLLTIVSALAGLAVLSGVLLWGTTSPLLRRRRRKRPAPTSG